LLVGVTVEVVVELGVGVGVVVDTCVVGTVGVRGVALNGVGVVGLGIPVRTSQLQAATVHGRGEGRVPLSPQTSVVPRMVAAAVRLATVEAPKSIGIVWFTQETFREVTLCVGSKKKATARIKPHGDKPVVTGVRRREMCGASLKRIRRWKAVLL